LFLYLVELNPVLNLSASVREISKEQVLITHTAKDLQNNQNKFKETYSIIQSPDCMELPSYMAQVNNKTWFQK
jgi:hypothetical protein